MLDPGLIRPFSIDIYCTYKTENKIYQRIIIKSIESNRKLEFKVSSNGMLINDSSTKYMSVGCFQFQMKNENLKNRKKVMTHLHTWLWLTNFVTGRRIERDKNCRNNGIFIVLNNMAIKWKRYSSINLANVTNAIKCCPKNKKHLTTHSKTTNCMFYEWKNLKCVLSFVENYVLNRHQECVLWTWLMPYNNNEFTIPVQSWRVEFLFCFLWRIYLLTKEVNKLLRILSICHVYQWAPLQVGFLLHRCTWIESRSLFFSF